MEITLMRVSGNTGRNSRRVLSLLRRHEYSESEGLGFRGLDIEEDGSVTGYSLKRTPFVVKVFDLGSNSMVERNEFVIDETFFRLDTRDRLIEVYGPAKDLRKLQIVFEQTVSRYLTLEAISWRPDQLFQIVRNAIPRSDVIKLKIRDFDSEPGVMGTYEIKSITPEKGWRYVEQFAAQIIMGSVLSQIDESDFITQIHANCKFRIASRPRSDINGVLRPIKDALNLNTGE
jgi:hypothetical protein